MSTPSQATHVPTEAPVAAGTLTRRLVAGVVGGMAGGMVFGMLMQMMGMLPTVAQLVGSTSAGVGWVVHLAISAMLGAGFALVAGRFLRVTRLAAAAGAAYGVVWWVLGALLIMPAKLGMPVLVVDAMAWKSLMGHVVYGALLGVVAAAVLRRGRRAH